MAKRKSNAQLKRLQKRAEDRGETYHENEAHAAPPTIECKQEDDDVPKEEIIEETKPQEGEATVDDIKEESKAEPSYDVKKISEKRAIALELKKELKAIDGNDEMKAKERRAAKRKAEAIATEKTGVSSAQELLEWLETLDTRPPPTKKRSLPNRSTPNILFIGQLTFNTTKDDILQCFRKHLKDTEDLKVADDALTVRLLTHTKNGKSKGMAFLEINDSDPMILYSCLKLHHTYLNGRRINVERTSGGGKATKQAKVATLRKSQVDYMKETVQTIVSEYDTSSLDEGVLALCERHNATIVHAAMERFVETGGPNKENPSAYLTALLQKLATEGIFDRTKKDGKPSMGKPKMNRNNSSPRRRERR